MAPHAIPLAERVWRHIDIDGPVPAHAPELGPCWIWTAFCDRNGYGKVHGDDDKPKFVHRVVFELLVGPIPEGTEPDHLCRNHPCCNPGHLDPVSHAENVRRGDGGRHHREKVACPQGHPYDETNTRLYQGRRYCRRCHTAPGRRARREARAVAA